ncbi:MAG: hypothetical protein KJI69_05145 [Patescibacteria group bacterium]|nr:hypothetical protein [Patescibacteria group bacterium]
MSFTPEQVKILQRASNDFVYFTNEVFSHSVKTFIKGEHVDNTARFLSSNSRTISVSARHHFKSFSFYSYFMWKMMFEGAANNVEAHYFSFNSELAGYHINKIKQCIEANPFFEDVIDAKPTAETVLKYTWDRKHYTTITPHGLVQFKRGIHGDLIFVDDPFQDPDNELNPTIIYKINEIFKSNILDMPKEPDGELHVCGTPQTKYDFFFDKVVTKRFATRVLPAIYIDEETGEEKALWPEWMDLEELKIKRIERTERIFSREYQCTPVYSTKGFFNKDVLKEKIVNKDLTMWKVTVAYPENNDIIAGFDIGKKSHPSHLSVFEYKDGKLVMIHNKFMDNWPYSNGKEYIPEAPSQLEYLKNCIRNFRIKELRYDNTRGEFESFDEQSLLPRQMIPVVFTSKFKSSGATAFDRLVEKQQIEIPDDERLLDQICAVTNDLQAIQTKFGHGDSFWSIVLAVMSAKDLIGFYDDSDVSQRRKISVGQRSMFAEGGKIPKGW